MKTSMKIASLIGFTLFTLQTAHAQMQNREGEPTNVKLTADSGNTSGDELLTQKMEQLQLLAKQVGAFTGEERSKAEAEIAQLQMEVVELVAQGFVAIEEPSKVEKKNALLNIASLDLNRNDLRVKKFRCDFTKSTGKLELAFEPSENGSSIISVLSPGGILLSEKRITANGEVKTLIELTQEVPPVCFVHIAIDGKMVTKKAQLF